MKLFDQFRRINILLEIYLILYKKQEIIVYLLVSDYWTRAIKVWLIQNIEAIKLFWFLILFTSSLNIF